MKATYGNISIEGTSEEIAEVLALLDCKHPSTPDNEELASVRKAYDAVEPLEVPLRQLLSQKREQQRTYERRHRAEKKNKTLKQDIKDAAYTLRNTSETITVLANKHGRDRQTIINLIHLQRKKMGLLRRYTPREQ